MADSRNLVLQLLITARDTASEVVDRVRAGLGGVGAAANAALEPLRSFGGLLSAAIGIGGAKQVIDLADAYTRLTNNIRVATKTDEEYQAALTAVIQVAKESNADLDTTAQLYGKVASNAKDLGLAQSDVADVTALVSKAMQLSGADTGAANGAILQFTQALGSGVLRGEEFNSVMEASPAMMNAIAAGMGVAVGELRKMAEAGQLTADVVVKSLLSQRDAINEVYGKLPQTVAQGMQQLGNAATLFAGQLNEQTGATQALGSGLKFLSQNLDAVTALIGSGLAVATTRGAVAMTGYVQASLAASAAAKDQAIAQAAATASAIRDAEAKVAAAQAAYNAALATQRQTSAVLTLMQANLGYGTSEADVAAARIAAANAANTATAATTRYSAAQAGLTAAQGAAATSASLLSRAMGFLAGPGGLILLAVSAFGLLYSAFSKQKPVTDDLTKSTDQYTESLKRMNAAQLNAELEKFNGALDDQRQVIIDAKAEVDKYKTGHIGLYEALTESKARAQLLTEAEGKQADAEAALKQLQENRKAVVEKLAAAEQVVADGSTELVTAYRQQSVSMDKVAGQYQDREKYLKTVADAQINETEALLDRAKASGDSNEVDRLTLQLAAQRAAAAKEQAELLRGEAVAAQLKVDALEKVKSLTNSLTPIEAQALQTARESAVAKNAEAQAAEALAGKLQYQTEHTLKLHAGSLLLLEVMAKEAEESAKNAAIKQVQIDASIALAKAKGDEAKAAELLAEKSAQTLQDAQDEIARNKERVVELDKVINKLYAEAQLKGMTPEQQKYIQGLMDEANERKRTIATIESKLPLMEQEKRQAEIMAGPVGQLTRLYAEQTKEHQLAAESSARYQSALTQEAENTLKLAKIKGDSAEIDKAQSALDAQKLQDAQAIANSKAIAATDAENELSAMTLKLAADGELSKADQEQLANMAAVAEARRSAANDSQNAADQLREEAAATREAADAAQKLAESEKAAAESAAQLKAAADGANSNLAAVNQAFVETGGNVEKLTAAFNEMRTSTVNGLSADPWIAWSASVAANADKVVESYHAQKNALDNNVATLQRFVNEGGNVNTIQQAMIQSSGNLQSQYRLLDEQDLANLRSAMDSANDKLREMQNEAQDAQLALAEMNAEILAESGNEAGANRLKLQIEESQKLAELEQKRMEADAMGNTAAAKYYAEMIAKLDELYALKKKNLEAEIAGADEDTKTTDKKINNVNRLKDAYGDLNKADLSGLQGQVNSLSESVANLQAML